MMEGVLSFKNSWNLAPELLDQVLWIGGEQNYPFFWKLPALKRGFGLMKLQPKPKI